MSGVAEVAGVLVVDDHPVVRRGLAGVFADQPDLRVVGEAATGEEAVVRARELEPDIVLMDLQMPGRGGAWATRQILADAARHDRATRVVVVTMFEADARVVEAMGAGAEDYVLKSSPPAEILRAVRQCAAGRRAPSARVAAALDAPGDALSAREVEVLRWAAQGLTNQAIAAELFIAPSTVKYHLAKAFLKLGVADRTHAVTEAIARELI
jgi:DNA-binding NarL/FixJ family response regulator